MRPTSIRKGNIGTSTVLHTTLFVIAMLSIAMSSANARAVALKPSDYRVSKANHKFEDARQFAVGFTMRSPRRLRAQRLELAVGAISTAAESRAFLSFGPVWRFPANSRSLFVELGFSPTLIGGSTFNGRDLGGNFHFTSSAAIGATFGRFDTVSVSLRAQHTSNGGLSDTNPGLDMFGLNFAFNFSNR